MLAENPFQGHRRRDLTRRSILFWVLTKYPNYVIVYDPHARPLAILRVLHGMRDLNRIQHLGGVGVPVTSAIGHRANTRSLAVSRQSGFVMVWLRPCSILPAAHPVDRVEL
jgi:hypothetical protein